MAIVAGDGARAGTAKHTGLQQWDPVVEQLAPNATVEVSDHVARARLKRGAELRPLRTGGRSGCGRRAMGKEGKGPGRG